MKMDYQEATRILTEKAEPVEVEEIPLEKCAGRVLGADIIAGENVPSFDRSPYDGYAFRAADTQEATEQTPVTLKVVENIRAGQMPERAINPGEAIRLMTGAPVPAGADAVCKYEDTEFTDNIVTLKKSYKSGDNVVTAGEDISKGSELMHRGYRIDAGMMGTLASLGIMSVPVYRKPVIGIISTGDEVVEPGEELPPGKIRNSNRYTIAAALESIGLETRYLGHADDTVEGISELISEGEKSCDLLISTGGVSVGDYDLVPDAMEACGYEVFTRGVAMKPGMACAYGKKTVTRQGTERAQLFLGLSGNPASSLTNLQCVCYPAIRKIAGLAEYEHKKTGFKSGSDITKIGKMGTRFIRGKVDFRDGDIVLDAPSSQGNVVISSAIRCDAYAIFSAGHAPVRQGDMIEGFMV